jgi:arsenate reductase-like glutaredoxin family protein
MTKKFLDNSGISYSVEDITNPKNKEQLERFLKDGYMAAPIVVTDKKTWSGYQIDNLKELV